MRVKSLAITALTLLIAVGITACGKGSGEAGFGAENKEVKDFVACLQENAYEDAIAQYNTAIAGNAELEAEAAECMNSYMADISAGLLSGKYDAGAAEVRSTTAQKVHSSTGCQISEYDELISDIEQALASRAAYESGLELFESENYREAITEFELVLPEDANYENASAKSKEASELYKEKVLEEAELLQKNGDYLEAISVLEEAAEIITEDSTLLSKINTCERQYISQTISDAEAVFTGADQYEEALGIIQSALAHYPDDPELAEKREYYVSFAPVNLYDLTPIKGEVSRLAADTDTYQTEHAKCFWNGYSWMVYSETNATFLIDRGYNRFTATIYGRSSKNQTGYYSVKIYGDGVTLYENTRIADNGSSFEISADVTGIKELTIVMESASGSVSDGIGMTEMILQRSKI